LQIERQRCRNLDVSLPRAHSLVDPDRIGMLGHSYGGNTVLFHGALDERTRFACASGAACSYRYKMAHGVGIEMAEVIPGLVTRYDLPDLVACFAPRQLLVVSATEDKSSLDADQILTEAQAMCAAAGVATRVEQLRYEGGHALTQERVEAILQWVTPWAG
jgi:hypothetical protein